MYTTTKFAPGGGKMRDPGNEVVRNQRFLPMKVGHFGKQPTSLNRGPGIGLRDFHSHTNHAKVMQKCHAQKKNMLLTGLELVLMVKNCDLRLKMLHDTDTDTVFHYTNLPAANDTNAGEFVRDQ